MDWPNFFASLVFPRRCADCGALLPCGAVCDACFSEMLESAAPFAARALSPQFYWLEKRASEPDGGPAPFRYIMGAAASYHRSRTLVALIHALKFRGIRAAAEPIADLMASYAMPLRRRLDGYEVIPVPLSRERLRSRGFNQSALIAASFAGRLSLGLSPNILVRTRNSPPQSAASGTAERMANVRGSFAVQPAAAGAARNARFVLIDDVTTTGATLLEAAKALATAGAAHIVALAAAKA